LHRCSPDKTQDDANPLGADGIVSRRKRSLPLVGHAPPHERRPEGPFGDHYGYYSLRHDYPVFNVEAVFHRRDAIYPATVVGQAAPGRLLHRRLPCRNSCRPLFPLVMPSVRDLWTYGETGFHSLAAAVVQERYGREALFRVFDSR
jgi:UbiD family decarboxylase